MGTPGFAVASLEKLVNEKYNVVAVVTVPDKPAGRGQKLQESEVKQFAVKNNIPVLQPEKLKAPEFLEQLKSFQPDLQIVVAFRMLPDVVWQFPPLGTFNLHGSLLPQYRGAAPINRAVMNGETQTGVTTFFLQHEIDTGNIIFRESFPIGKNETAGEVHDRMMVIGANLVTKTVNAIASGNVPQTAQSSLVKPGEEIKPAPKIFREDCKINWEVPGKKIHDHIRGLSPYPAAWTELHRADGELILLKFYKSEFISVNHDYKVGSVISKLEVAVKDGIVKILEVQAPGKKKISSEEFLRGFRFNEGDLLK
jgi:methionyl-tRNA formyltransferase